MYELFIGMAVGAAGGSPHEGPKMQRGGDAGGRSVGCDCTDATD
jgi:hypothetical protein